MAADALLPAPLKAEVDAFLQKRAPANFLLTLRGKLSLSPQVCWCLVLATHVWVAGSFTQARTQLILCSQPCWYLAALPC